MKLIPYAGIRSALGPPQNRAVAIGLGTHSVLRVAMLEDTHFDLLEWTPNGPSSVAEWLINPILVGSIEDDPRSLVLWLQVTFVLRPGRQ